MPEAALASSGTAVGTVKKMRLNPMGVLSATVQGTKQGKVLILSSDGDYFTHTGAKQIRAGQTQLLVLLLNLGLDGKTLPVTEGAYGAGTPSLTLQTAVATLGTFGVACSYSSPDSVAVASSGTITLTRVDDMGVAGKYDLSFDGETLTGEFSAPVRGAMDTLFADAATQTNASSHFIYSCID